MFTADELLAALRAEGITRIVEVDGWRTRGYDTLDVQFIVNHHTAGGGGPTDMNDAKFMVDGRADLAGPLCNSLTGKDGTLYLIALRRARHAGPGAREVYDRVIRDLAPLGDAGKLGYDDDDTAHGNRFSWGNEVDHPGDASPYPAAQIDTVVRLNAALCRLQRMTAARAIHHREWTRRKIDMSWRGDLRGLVAARLNEGNQPVTDIKDDVRAVLNEGTAKGQTTWAGTSKALLAAVQNNANKLNAVKTQIAGAVTAIKEAVAGVAGQVAEVKKVVDEIAARPHSPAAACACSPESIGQAVDAALAERFRKAGA